MRIGLNNSLLASRELGKTSQAIQRSLERLSTGKRVNSARDDVASLSSLSRLEAQGRGVVQAVQNLNSAVAILNTAEGSMGLQMDILSRMREIAVQGANGTLTTEDRRNLDTELDSLLAEFNRIALNTEFDGTKLLDGSFGSKQIQAGANYGDLIDIDLDGTRQLDLFQESITSNLGTTTETSYVMTSATNPNDGVAVDLDGDGDLDIAAIDISTSDVYTYLNDGTGAFSFADTIDASPGQHFLSAPGDIDKDGTQDVVVANSTGGISIVFGDGAGNFSSKQTLTVGNTRGIDTGDVDLDGNIDVIATEKTSNSIEIYFGNGDGSFQAATTLDSDVAPEFLDLYDMNNDGEVDIIVGNETASNVAIYLGNGDGTYQDRFTVTTGTGGDAVFGGDFNNDGIADFVTGQDSVLVYLGNGDNTFYEAYSFFEAGIKDFKIGDYDNDGNLDVITGNETTRIGRVLLNDGTGSNFTAQTLSSLFDVPGQIADLNGDGFNDVFGFDDATGNMNVVLTDTETRDTMVTPSVESQAKATQALTYLDNAIARLQSAQANVGALHSRLNVARDYASLLGENIRESKSVMESADFALETAELVKNQILQQAQVAVMAQANTQIRLILELFN